MWRHEHEDEALAPELAALDRALAGAGAEDLGAEHADLAVLVAAVRDDRPPRRPAFDDELAARVAAGFPRRGARRQPQARHWLVGLGAVATVAAVLIAVGLGTSNRPASPAVRGLNTLGSASPQQSLAAPSADSAAGASPVAGATASGPRAVRRDASLALLAPRGQVQEVSDRAVAATDRLGGIVESSNVAVDDHGGSQASLQLRVPSAELDRLLSALSGLAHVSSRSQGALDITDATAVARNRLADSRAERAALLRALAHATTANQVASIHARIGLVAGRIAQDQARVQTLVGQSRSAEVSLTIDEDSQTAGGGGGGWGPAAALDDAVSVLEAVFAVLVIGLAGFVPVAIFGALLWWAGRLLRRRRRDAALATL